MRTWPLLVLLGPAALATQTAGESPLAPISGGSNQWTSTGPSVSSVLVVTPDPKSARTVYCAANGIVHASGNRGDRWVPANTGIVGFVLDLAVHPSRADVFLAFGSRLFKSTNGVRSLPPLYVRLPPGDSLFRAIWAQWTP